MVIARHWRLDAKKEFMLAFHKGVRFHTDHLTAYSYKPKLDCSAVKTKIAVMIPKQHAPLATLRTVIKRKIKGRLLPFLRQGKIQGIIIIRLRKQIAKQSLSQLEAESEKIIFNLTTV